MQKQAAFSPYSRRDPKSYPESYPVTLPDTVTGIVGLWCVSLKVGELHVPLTFDFTEAADAYTALRQVRARYPLATVRRSAAARLALVHDPERDHG